MRAYWVYGVAVLALWGLSANPTQAQEQGGRGRNSRIYVVPAPADVKIDGDLSDWDLSGQILIYVTQETSEMQSAKVAMMYDAEALFISGVMRDPTPMVNKHDPKVEAEKGWDADAFQLRLALDPALGYPVNESSFEPKPNDQLCHLLLWYYTDRKEPCLQLRYGMNYALPKEDWPQGMVPAGKFQGAYRPAEDKRGYTFEYRIPWSTLAAKKPLKGGVLVASAIQIQWGAPDGLSSTGGGWAMDLMATPGFTFQSTACWGRAIFSEKGHLPKELTQEGLPVEAPLPLTFEYELPKSGDVTVALFNEQGQMVRNVVMQASRKAGRVTERWDGLDDAAAPLPPGKYAWRGIYHDPIKTTYLLAVHNSGTPTYATADGTGAWGSDHGRPSAVCSAGDHMVLAWDGGEAGWSVLRTDLQGKRQWGIRPGAVHIASDGKERIFASGGFGFHDGSGVECFALSDGRPINFGSGKPKVDEPEAKPADVPGGSAFPFTPADLADKEKAGRLRAVSGLAYAGGKLYVSYGRLNLICVYDATAGKILEKWPVANPQRFAARPDGSLAVLSEGKLLSVAGGKVSLLAGDHLDKPVSVAVDTDGSVYVANGGRLQSISVFTQDGKYVRSVGEEGGRPAVGPYDPSGMYEPGGIAVDKDGKLWVAETTDSPKRISVWDAKSGRLLKEFFGASQYATFVSMDPTVEDEVYCHMTIWKVALDKGTWRPHSTMWRATKDNMVAAAYDSVRVIRATNGRQFAWGKSNYASVLYMRDGDVFKPILAGILVAKGNQFVAWPPYPLFRDNQEWPNGAYVWQDANDDQVLQAEEIVKAPSKRGESIFNWVDEEMNLYSDEGFVLKPARFDGDRPVYDLAKPEPIHVAGNGGFGGLFVDPQDKGFYCIKGQGDGDASGPGFGRYRPDGSLMWGWRMTGAWTSTLNKPIPKPGQVWGITAPLGVAGEITGVATYFGAFHLFTRDGMYVAMLFKDQRLGEMGPDVINAEAFAGQLIKAAKSGRYLLLAGDTDGRVTEVLGLDTIQRFEGSYTLSPGDAAKAKEAQAEFAKAKARSQALAIVRGRPALELAKPVRKTIDAQRGFSARLAYDEENLYVGYDVDSPQELSNAIPDPRIIFKGGNLLDIQLAADPQADPKRTTPAPGDLRVLITRQKDKPFAVIYRPKVKGFNGEAIVLTSPTGKESFDQIQAIETLEMQYQKRPGGFRVTAVLHLELLGWEPTPGATVRIDLGYLFGNATGSQCGQRAYWSNTSPTSGIIGDIPSESRLEPAQWGSATVE